MKQTIKKDIIRIITIFLAALIMAVNIGWTMPIRFLVGATAALIIADTAKTLINGFRAEKDE